MTMNNVVEQSIPLGVTQEEIDQERTLTERMAAAIRQEPPQPKSPQSLSRSYATMVNQRAAAEREKVLRQRRSWAMLVGRDDHPEPGDIEMLDDLLASLTLPDGKPLNHRHFEEDVAAVKNWHDLHASLGRLEVLARESKEQHDAARAELDRYNGLMFNKVIVPEVHIRQQREAAAHLGVLGDAHRTIVDKIRQTREEIRLLEVRNVRAFEWGREAKK
jgi:hypothetical protein